MDRFRLSGHTDDERWFRAGTVDVTTTVFVTGLTALTMLVWVASPKERFTSLTEAVWLRPLELHSSKVRSGEVWRVLTWPLANAVSLWSVIGLALFFLFGREIERHLRRVPFAWMLAVLTVVPGIAAALIGVDAAGIETVEFVLFGMYVLLYPQARSFFNIPLWVLGAVLLGVQVLTALADRDWERLAFLAVLAGTGLLALRAFGLGDEYPWIPRVPLPAFVTRNPYQKADRARQKAQRSQQRRGDNVVPMAPRAPVTLDRDAQADMDRLLDKIAASGIDSLSAEERRRLDEHSRRLRGQ